MVYDLTGRNSLEKLNDYYKDAIQCINIETIVLNSIRKKCDLYEKEEVSLDEGNIFSEQINAHNFKCSCYDLDIVNINFQKMAKFILTNISEHMKN